MKTIVFALQVFGIIALLPLCVVLEMNYGNGSASAIENKAPAINKTGSASEDFSNSITTALPITFLTSKQAAVKLKKKSGDTCCSCKNCKCGTNCTCADL